MRITGNDNGAMNTLKKSQTGRKLLQEAEKRGVNIQFKPDNGDSTMGQYNPNTKTITVEQGNIEKMTEVLGHELVHASTPENGNSMKEEKMAFIIGEKIAGEAGVNKDPHTESYWNNHVNSAYSGLKNDNGIMSALSALDLAANQATAANTAATNATNNADTATNATNTGNTAANATPAQENNPFDIANNNNQQTQQNNPQNGFMQMMMQFFMMMIQMFMQNRPNNNQNQQQNTQQNAQLNPFAFQALNVSA